MLSSFQSPCVQGLDPSRDPLVDTDGCFFVVICATAFSWYLGLIVYGGVLTFCGAAPQHVPNSGMAGVDYAGYNFALGGKHKACSGERTRPYKKGAFLVVCV